MSVQTATEAMLAANKATVRRFIEEVINQNNLDLIDTLFAPHRRKEVRGFHAAENAPFPDAQEEILDLVAEGNTVMVRWIFRGTHQGRFFDIPATGRPVEMIGYGVYYLENGQIVDETMVMDWQDALEQLGATLIPPAGSSA
jgi:predicted ester cyclase